MKKQFFALVASIFLLTGGMASAASLTTPTYSAGPPWTINNIANWDTTGNLMDGMQVTARWRDSSNTVKSETLSWLGGTGVSSSANGWSLTMEHYDWSTWWNDTYWTASNTSASSLIDLTIDGELGNTVFDRVAELGVVDDTPGSARGREIVMAPSDLQNGDFTVDAAYSNIVGVGLNPAAGDLYRTITLSFSGGSFANGAKFVFAADTDNVNAPVPEPATMILFGIGLTGLAGMRIKRRK